MAWWNGEFMVMIEETTQMTPILEDKTPILKQMYNVYMGQFKLDWIFDKWWEKVIIAIDFIWSIICIIYFIWRII